MLVAQSDVEKHILSGIDLSTLSTSTAGRGSPRTIKFSILIYHF